MAGVITSLIFPMMYGLSNGSWNLPVMPWAASEVDWHRETESAISSFRVFSYFFFFSGPSNSLPRKPSGLSFCAGNWLWCFFRMFLMMSGFGLSFRSSQLFRSWRRLTTFQ
jgi:hypothetical protein